MGLSENHLEYFASLDSASSSIASDIYEGICRSNLYRLAIPGGRSPGPILSKLRDRFLSGSQEQIEKLKLYWIDERCVPPEHPESNFGQSMESFIKPLHMSHKSFFRIRGELGAPAAARDYNELLGALADGGGHIDYALIGMGEDGHIASLFPKAPELTVMDAWAVAAFPETAPYDRVSVTFSFFRRLVLRNLVLAFGDSKAALLRSACQHQSPNFPVSLLPFDQGNVRVASEPANPEVRP